MVVQYHVEKIPSEILLGAAQIQDPVTGRRAGRGGRGDDAERGADAGRGERHAGLGSREAREGRCRGACRSR